MTGNRRSAPSIAATKELSTNGRPHSPWPAILEQLPPWSWQRPARRELERNDDAIPRWVKQRWPQLKNSRGASRHHSARPRKWG
jgi:hypothetical protein